MLSNTASLIGILGLKFAPNLTELFVGPGFCDANWDKIPFKYDGAILREKNLVQPLKTFLRFF